MITVISRFLEALHYEYHLFGYEMNLENRFARINGSTFIGKTNNAIGSNILAFLYTAKTYHHFVLYLQRLFWAIGEINASPNDVTQWGKAVNNFVTALNAAIDLSAGITLRKIEFAKNGIELYPEGIKILDDVVDQNAVWLSSFPDIAKEYHNSLRIASTKETASYRQALDGLRYSLENLLKLVLDNSKPLEKQKEPLQKWMKSKNVHAQIRNNYTTVLDQFTLYQNSSVKHSSNPDPDEARSYSAAELEYMIYLTSTLIRFILELYRASTNSDNQ